jgi:hypothetical protein
MLFCSYNFICFCYEVEGETIRLIMPLTKDFMAFGTRLLVKIVKDGNVLHHFKFSFDFDLLMMKEVSDWVKV